VSEKLHPIQVVVRRTGLTADVLRAWERRYRVVEPGRSPTGRRLYSDEDIERLRLLRRATLSGRSIGQVSDLPTVELVRLIRDDEAEEARAPEPAPQRSDLMQQFRLEALDAVEELDGTALRRLLQRAATAFGAERALEEVTAPVLTEVGDRWQAGDLSIAHEHLTSAVIRQVVGDLLRSASDDADRPLALFATPAGERHEFGALMAAVIAATRGWRILYLGADIPAADIARAALRHRPRLVAVSVVSRELGRQLAAELSELREALPSEATLVVGGRGLAPHDTLLNEIGAVRIDGLAALRDYLEAGAPAPDRR
jgi:DNA-binding transcriptional MerR regulator/methylmalonyl-CoA mutase cobalamin-binding subunit